MENRRAMPPLYFEKAKEPKEYKPAPKGFWASDEEISAAKKRMAAREKNRAAARAVYTTHLRQEAMKNDSKKSMEIDDMTRPYTMDEITTAQLLKGHPRAEEIVDALFKSNKKTEGGEEFQDGSEDSIGPEGHAAPARPGTIKHEGGNPVPGPDHPGTAAKNASVEDENLQKSEEDDLKKSGVERGTLTDNEPNEFKEGMEEDDTIPEGDEGETAEEVQVGKSFTQDEATLEQLRKSLGEERFEEIIKAIIPKYGIPGALSSKVNAPSEQQVAENPLINRKADPVKIAALQAKLRANTEKSEGEDNDLEKGEEMEDLEKAGKHPQKTERAEWAKDREEEEREHGQKSEEPEALNLSYSPDVLKAMGLYKGSPSVSKKVSGGKATQIAYGSEHGEEFGKRGKPETRYTHPRGKTEKRYRFEPAKGEVTVRERTKGEKEFKEKKIGAGEESKLKNASTSSPDLHKALDDILDKHRG